MLLKVISNHLKKNCTVNENTQQPNKKYNSGWKKLTSGAIFFLQF